MTKQEYYDLLVRTSAEGGFPSMEGGRCRYRTDTGRRCAVGLLIPDEMYEPGMETNNAYWLERRFPQVQAVFPDEMDADELRRVQTVHDELAQDLGWDHQSFVANLNTLHCFVDVVKS